MANTLSGGFYRPSELGAGKVFFCYLLIKSLPEPPKYYISILNKMGHDPIKTGTCIFRGTWRVEAPNLGRPFVGVLDYSAG